MRVAASVLAALSLSTAAFAQTAYAPATTAPVGMSACPGGLCQPQALDSLFVALSDTEAGRRSAPVHILQIGDSHTAGDRIPGKLRVDLQARFGAGGRGVLPAGALYRGYAPLQVTMTANDWTSETSPLQPPSGRATAAFGLAGMRGSVSADSTLTLAFEPGAEARHFGVCGWARGDGDGLVLDVAGEPWTINLNTLDGRGPSCLEFDLDRPLRTLTLKGTGAGVVLDSVWTDARKPGVVVSSLGVIGATLRDLAARDADLSQTQLGAWKPSLVVLAFGTNEGFDDGLDPLAYERLLRAQIARIQSHAWDASILILGAPDALRNGVTTGCSADGKRNPPPSLALVRDVQRRVAADMGVAYWDWHGRMGGDCSADRLALMAEPHMRGDRVHFSNVGADWIGGVLSADLLAAYDGWMRRGGR